MCANHQRRRKLLELDYSPVSWTQYFDEAFDVEDTNGYFRVYLKGFKPPLAPTRQLGTKLNNQDISLVELEKFNKIPTLVLLHGGGYSGLTWSLFCKEITNLCQVRCLAMDLRGHGDTKTNNDSDLSINTLVNDVFEVVHTVHSQICGFVHELPKLVLVGHSMGGAIAIKCSTKCEQRLPSLVGFVVIDVVEGTAKEALPVMMSVIKSRPKVFPSLPNAIEWTIKSGMTKNIDSAKVSMPGNLINIETRNLSMHDELITNDQNISLLKHKHYLNFGELTNDKKGSSTMKFCTLKPPIQPRHIELIRSETSIPFQPKQAWSRESLEELPEEDIDVCDKESPVINMPGEIEDASSYKKPHEVTSEGFTWRTCLNKTNVFWDGWFDGLSMELLDAPVQGKFLLLAGIDRLDRTLTVGQMQGKFMMKVLPKCGHAVHEDVPESVAKEISEFLKRNKITV